MKKIVALVLAMVMVLGLATTAFAATAAMGDVEAAVANKGFTVEVKAAAPAVDSAKMFATYQLFFTDKETKAVTVVGPLAEVAVADQAQYTYVDGKIVRYFADVDTYDFTVKAVKAVAKEKPACGDIVVDEDTTFYVDAKGNYYVAAEATATDIASVDGKAIALEATTVTKKAHNYDYDTASVNGKTVVTKVYCKDCKANFTFIEGTYTDAVEKFGAGNFELAFGKVYVATATASAPAAGETVESAKTFDAGIAMYVGMSVMAAAGSAVVLKKKD